MIRDDISEAIGKTPVNVQEDIQKATRCVTLLNAHLPEEEVVKLISSAAPKWSGSPVANSLLVLTDRRLLFLAPSPQVVSWPLTSLTRVQALSGQTGAIVAFFVDDTSGGKYQLGIDGAWGDTFENMAKVAVAIATLRQG